MKSDRWSSDPKPDEVLYCATETDCALHVIEQRKVIEAAKQRMNLTKSLRAFAAIFDEFQEKSTDAFYLLTRYDTHRQRFTESLHYFATVF